MGDWWDIVYAVAVNGEWHVYIGRMEILMLHLRAHGDAAVMPLWLMVKPGVGPFLSFAADEAFASISDRFPAEPLTGEERVDLGILADGDMLGMDGL